LNLFRLEAIETGIFPRLTVTDLDTKKKMILAQDKEVNGLRVFSEVPLDPPAPEPAPTAASVVEPTPPPTAELPPVPAAPVPPPAPAPIPAPQ
ncbi:MAG: hypothetical protein JWO89_705, partial [Verrucomicrobiaceae bacterium]|nr:hypothetical protein [Verrucomicrobiaceae bacterium]